jgi:hypothetical protein
LEHDTLRLAAYGDPAAVPFFVWRDLLTNAKGWSGYTHQWRTCDQRFREICMASVESEHERHAAEQLGWRAFRTRLASEPLRADEIMCPASEEAGYRATCETCRLCVGTARAAARSIAILAHGNRTRFFEEQKAQATA